MCKIYLVSSKQSHLLPTMEDISEEKIKSGVAKLRELVLEYASSKDTRSEVRDYLSKVLNDEELLEGYLVCRKLNVESAFEKLKGLTELRFNVYPEVFPATFPELGFSVQQRGILGILKARDNHGRRVIYLNVALWDPKEFGLTEITAIGATFTDIMLRDKDAMNNGVIMVQDCGNMGLAHARHYSLHAMRRLVNVFLRSSPFRIKGMYYINLPLILVYLPELIKPFFPKKLKDRLHVSGYSKGWEDIHKIIDPAKLPKFLGGPLDIGEAGDEKFYRF